MCKADNSTTDHPPFRPWFLLCSYLRPSFRSSTSSRSKLPGYIFATEPLADVFNFLGSVTGRNTSPKRILHQRFLLKPVCCQPQILRQATALPTKLDLFKSAANMSDTFEKRLFLRIIYPTKSQYLASS